MRCGVVVCAASSVGLSVGRSAEQRDEEMCAGGMGRGGADGGVRGASFVCPLCLFSWTPMDPLDWDWTLPGPARLSRLGDAWGGTGAWWFVWGGTLLGIAHGYCGITLLYCL